MAVVCVGQSAYDIVIPYDGELTENQKYRVRDRLEGGGGARPPCPPASSMATHSFFTSYHLSV